MLGFDFKQMFSSLSRKDSTVLGLMLICAIVIDLITPLGTAGALPYLFVVLYAGGSREVSAKQLRVISAIVLVLVVAGFWLSPPSSIAGWMSIVSRGMTFIAVMFASLLSLRKKAATSSLRESEASFRDLLENISGVFWLHSIDDHRMLYVSSQYEKIWGKDPQSLYKNPREWLDQIHPEDRPRVESQYFSDIARRLPFTSRFRIVRSDGSERWIVDKGFPIFDDLGNCVRYGGIAEDVTDQRLLEESEKRAHLLEAENRNKTEFVAKVSHELRTPLAAIEGFGELLAESSHLDDAENRMIKLLNRNSRYLHAMVDDLLDVSSLACGYLDFDTSVFDFVAEVEEVCDLFVPLVAEKGLTFSVSHELPQLLVRADKNRNRQILVNLLSNAFKFTQEGSVKLRTFLQAEDSGAISAAIEVTDSGIGIEDQKLLFSKFHRQSFAKTKGVPGFGIGLHLSRELATRMKGTLCLISSVAGEGSCFRFCLPIADDSELKEQMKESAGRSITADVSLHGRHVLIADDSEDIQELLQMMLNNAGATVSICENGLQAVEQANDSVDIVLMDVSMPVLDGFQATKLLRERGFTKPIIALTAHAFGADRDRCIAFGCSGYLAKPVGQKQLCQAIASYFAH